MSIVHEREEGLIERTIVTGVTTFQYLSALVLANGMLIIFQVGLVFFTVFGLFSIPYNGSFLLVLLAAVLQSLCGMSFGLLVSAVSPNVAFATMFSLGVFYPNLLLSGTVWPLEGMSDWVRIMSYFLPQTYPIEGLRSIMSRGWGLSHYDVQMGFIVSIVWIAIFTLAAALVFRHRQ